MIEKDDHVFLNSINQMDMITSRLLVRTKFDDATEMIKSILKYFEDNKRNHNYQVVAEALEILIYHYGEFQSKIPSGAFHEVVTEQLHYFLGERKKINIEPM